MRKNIWIIIPLLFGFHVAVGQNSPGMPSGNIGIGVTSAPLPLQVHNITVPANTIGSVSEIANFSGETPNVSQFKFLHRRHTLNSSWENIGSRLQFVTDVTNQGYIEFNPAGDPYGIAIGSTNGEIMRFKNSKFVGIGTANPRELLQLGDRFTFQDGGWKALNYNAAWDPNLNLNVRILSAPSSSVYFTDLGNIIFQTAPTGAAGSSLTNAVHSLVIHNSGQVGIGTAPTKTSFVDANFKLHVEGGIRARKVRVDQASWPDYVFDSAYYLRPLKEVETFIQKNKHLPDVVSAATVESEGLDLGENQAVLLKKIEELTLYILQQEKRLVAQEEKQRQQQAEIEALRKKNN